MSRHMCPFCEALASGDLGNTGAFVAAFDGQLPSRILRETENFCVLPTLGQIVEGYLLIMPKTHYQSVAHVPRGLHKELEHLLEETRQVLTERYGPPIFCEHGAVNSTQRAGCCVDHAHVHAVPCPVDLAPELRRHLRERRVGKLVELTGQVRRGTGYLFYQDAASNGYVYDAPVVPKQYLRQLIACQLGVSDRWDWRVTVGKTELLNTVRRLSHWSDDPPVAWRSSVG